MNVKWIQQAACAVALASLVACGGGSGNADPAAASGSGSAPTPQVGNMALMISDAPAQDWALVGVKVESIALVPQGGGSDVTA